MKVQNVKAFSKRQIGPQAERNQNKKGFRLPKPRQQAVKQITVQQRAQKPQVVGKGRTVPEKQVSRAFSEKHVSCRFQGQASLSVQHDSRHRKYTALAQRYIRRVLRNLRQSTAGSFPLEKYPLIMKNSGTANRASPSTSSPAFPGKRQ